MRFNPVDKTDSIIAQIDFLLFGDGSTLNTKYSLVDRTRNVNIALDEIIAELFKADPNFMWDDITNTDFPIATIDLEAGKDHYTLPDSSLVIHRLRIKDRNGYYKTLTPRLRRELDDDTLRSTGVPSYYYKIDNAVFPIPIPDYSASSGVELEFQRGANHFDSDDTNKSPGFAAQFHQFLPVCAAYQYAIANSMDKKSNMLINQKESIRKMIQEHYERRSPDERPRMRLKRQSVNRYGL